MNKRIRKKLAKRRGFRTWAVYRSLYFYRVRARYSVGASYSASTIRIV